MLTSHAARVQRRRVVFSVLCEVHGETFHKLEIVQKPRSCSVASGIDHPHEKGLLMHRPFRFPWTAPSKPDPLATLDGAALAYSPSDPWGHLVAISAWRYRHEDHRGAQPLECSSWDPLRECFEDGPLRGASLEVLGEEVLLPVLFDKKTREILCDDPITISRMLAPKLFERDAQAQIESLREGILDAVYELGQLDDQATYEEEHSRLAASLEVLDEALQDARFLGGDHPDIADYLLFTFSARHEPVYYELYKASVGWLDYYPSILDHARDLYELPEVHETTDFDRIKQGHYLVEPLLNPKKIIPLGGIPDFDAPHFRAEWFGQHGEGGVEEDQQLTRGDGEWVRPVSDERSWISADGSGKYPAQAGRYHLYAPYNCPWSHRALLGRAVLGLEDVIGASIVYFRRDPEHGWQFNPEIPGCTPDQAQGKRYIAELYDSVGSSERSVPLLWDTQTETIVSNESAEILRMLNESFKAFATRPVDLYPAMYRDVIERINEMVYQRINNGAYKAGFTDTQHAYERAFKRYFRALDWLEEWLGEQKWLAHTEHPTEADVRLFPTLFRHDAVYYSRFKLNARTIASYPKLGAWLERMTELPGVLEASNLDHARNGYFGRTGNEIVPAGPLPLGLSPKDFTREVWLGSKA